MRWSVKIVRVAGTEVRIHLTFLLLLAWLAYIYYQIGGRAAAIQGVVLILALFGCVLLHEFGHAFAARAFGIRTPDITLLPIGGVARLQRMPDRPWQEFLVAIAGPAVNFLIAGAIVFGLGRDVSFAQVQFAGQEGQMLANLATVNVWLALFNLIPAFPMDGGRVLRALLATFMNYTRATQIAAGIGQALAFVFGFLGLIAPNPLLIFVALFVYLGAQQEAATAGLKDLARNLSVAEGMVTELVRLPRHATLERAIEALLRTTQHEFPVVDETDRVVGVLMRDDMIRALKRADPASSVQEVMRRDLPTLRPDDPFDEAFRRMQECRCPALPVADEARRFLGLFTAENVGEMMLVHSVRPRDGLPAWRTRPTHS